MYVSMYAWSEWVTVTDSQDINSDGWTLDLRWKGSGAWLNANSASAWSATLLNRMFPQIDNNNNNNNNRPNESGGSVTFFFWLFLGRCVKNLCYGVQESFDGRVVTRGSHHAHSTCLPQDLSRKLCLMQVFWLGDEVELQRGCKSKVFNGPPRLATNRQITMEYAVRPDEPRQAPTNQRTNKPFSLEHLDVWGNGPAKVLEKFSSIPLHYIIFSYGTFLCLPQTCAFYPSKPCCR